MYHNDKDFRFQLCALIFFMASLGFLILALITTVKERTEARFQDQLEACNERLGAIVQDD